MTAASVTSLRLDLNVDCTKSKFSMSLMAEARRCCSSNDVASVFTCTPLMSSTTPWALSTSSATTDTATSPDWRRLAANQHCNTATFTCHHRPNPYPSLLPYLPSSPSHFLHFNGHFPGGPGLAGNRMSPFWIYWNWAEWRWWWQLEL